MNVQPVLQEFCFSCLTEKAIFEVYFYSSAEIMYKHKFRYCQDLGLFLMYEFEKKLGQVSNLKDISTTDT